MHEADAKRSSVPWGWTCQRKKSKKAKKTAATVGDVGTIGECMAGAVVACESLDGRRIIWLTIAWQWPDGKAAAVRIYNQEAREIDLTAQFLRTVQAGQRVRWLGVRQ